MDKRPLVIYPIIVLLALLMALSYQLFVFPNAFAPAGINGIITMIQHLAHISIGYLSLAVNLPLILIARRRIDRDFAKKTLLFVLSFSIATLLLQQLDLSTLAYHTENGTSLILGPLTAGAVSGFCYGVLFRHNGSTGGMDIIAAYVRQKKPEVSFVWIIFILNASVAAISFFVYGYQFEPVIMCLIYCYISSDISDRMLRGVKKALKFEVITSDPEALSNALLKELHHGVTVLPAEGMYSGEKRSLLVCIVNPHQIAAFESILARFPGSFSYVSEVSETVGNFKKIK